MKKVSIAAIGLCLFGGLVGGCAIQRASIEGHDFIDTAVVNLRVGFDEYHADDRERLSQVREELLRAFVKDVAAVKNDEARVEAKAREYAALLGRACRAGRVEEQRYRNMCNTLAALGEVNGSLRDLAEIRLGWKSEIVDYANRLRKKVDDGRSGKRTDQGPR